MSIFRLFQRRRKFHPIKDRGYLFVSSWRPTLLGKKTEYDFDVIAPGTPDDVIRALIYKALDGEEEKK